MEIGKDRLFLPMREKAINSLFSFLEVELAKDVFNLIHFKQKEKLDDNILSRKFPKVAEAEREFNFDIVQMYWEVEQLFNLTPPVIHKIIRKELREDISYLEEEFKKRAIIEKLKSNNQSEVIVSKESTGEKRKAAFPREKQDRIDLKIIETKLFDEYLDFLYDLLRKFKHELSFFLPIDNRTPITFSEREDRTESSVFTDYTIDRILMDKEKFYSICVMLSAEVNDPNSVDTYKLISYNKAQKSFHWNGIGKKESIPTLGKLIRRLYEVGVISIPKKEKVSRLVLEFFNIPINDSKVNFLGRHFEPGYTTKAEKFIKSIIK